MPPPTFLYVGGDPSLDLVNTARWADGVPLDDGLDSYAALTRWAEGAELLPQATGAALRTRAAQQPGDAHITLERALSLRALFERAFGAVVGHTGMRAHDLDAFNAAFSDALAHLQLSAAPIPADPGVITWSWRAWGDVFDSPLWPVVWSAARLLASDERARVRRCAGERCGRLYVDRSRNGMRRWCRTDRCGARAKAKRHYARKRATS